MTTELDLFAEYVVKNVKKKKIEDKSKYFCNQKCKENVINKWNQNINYNESIYYIFSIIDLLDKKKIILHECSYWQFLKYLKPQENLIKNYVDQCNKNIKIFTEIIDRVDGKAKESLQNKIKSNKYYIKTFNIYLVLCNDTPINYLFEPNINNILDVMKLLCIIKIETMKIKYKKNFSFDECFNHLELQFSQNYKYTAYV